jgi:hypothetical protein
MNSSIKSRQESPNKEFIGSIINRIIENATNINEVNGHPSLIMRYDPPSTDYIPFMKRKISAIQKEVIDSFGGSSLNLQKRFSRVEREKMIMKQNQNNNQNTPVTKDKDENDINFINCKSNLNAFTSNSFMNDVKIHKSRIEKDKEEAKSKQLMMANNNNILLGHKRKEPFNSDINSFSYESNIKKRRNAFNDFSEDWATVMSTSLKKKSQVQQEKEKYLDEVQKNKEVRLKSKNENLKNQVMKFDI